MDRIENILDIGGRQLSPGERQFVTTLLNELEHFQFSASKDRALMFHPLGGFQRYLIHKVTQVFPRLTSFSIGDEKNRRTVVCFKSKKRDQMSLQGLGASRTEASSRNEYVNSPQRSVDQELSRRSTPTAARSRESSRNRKKHDEPSANKVPVRNKAESSNYLPKPLRSKKAATKRDQMKRSRSLQSSPLRTGGGGDDDPYAPEEDGRRGRSRSQSGKQPRSASLKPSSKRRDRTESPNLSEVNRKIRKAPLRPNVSDASLKKRGQGLRLEGRVMNGDVEDPYSCGESESDLARVDAEAIRHENLRHRKAHPQSYASSSSEETRSSEKSSAGSDSEVSSDEEHFYENTANFESADSDGHPPSYSSLKRSASLKKAHRNLDRIKQAESNSRRTSKEEEESSGEESSSEESPLPSRKPSSSRSTRSSSKKSLTLPKASRESSRRSAPDTQKSHTLKSSSSSRKKMHDTLSEKPSKKREHSTPPGRRREHDTPPDRRKDHNTTPEKRREQSSPPERRRDHHTPPEKRRDQQTLPQRRREHSSPRERRKDHSTPPQRRKEDDRLSKTSSTKSKPPSSHSSRKENITEDDCRQRTKERRDEVKHRGIPEDDSDASLSEEENNDIVAEKEQKTATQPMSQSEIAVETNSLHDFPAQCEGGTQTEVSGTLSRKPKEAVPSSDAPESSQAKSVGDILAAMVQSLQSQQGNQPTYQQPPFNPNLNAFHHVLNQAPPPPPPSSFPPLPPHLIHHIYMSWLGAYYAGATGTLPPPPPFVLPNTLNPSTGTPVTPLDFLPPNFPHMSNVGTEAEKQSERSKNEEHYYKDMYSSDPQFEERLANESNPEPIQKTEELDFVAPRSFPDAEKPSDEERGRKVTKTPQQPPIRDNSSSSRGRYGSSVVLTDTDTSSIVSSGKRADAGGKPGVVVYVRSQPSSRKSSVAHDSVDSDVGSAAHSSDHGSQRKSRVSEVKKSKQRQAVRDRASTPHKREGEIVTHNNPPQTSNPPQPANTAPMHATPTQPAPAREASTETEPNTSSMLQDGVPDASQEEIILSLRRAPLATIEDDADELSTSLASSAASLNASGEAGSGEKPLADSDSSPSSASEGSSIIVEMHAITPTSDHKPDEFPPPPYKAASPSTLRDLQVPPIDQSTDESSSDEETPPAVPTHNGVGPSDASSISEGDHEMHPSDSSYDADQSRVDDAGQARKVHHNDVNNSSLRDVTDDVVVQDPQFNYYKGQLGEWNAAKYNRFVEIFNFPPKLSDIEISRYLTKYKGLRLTRTDKTLALCTLPSEEVANELLRDSFPIFKTRPLRDASEKSKKKARSKLKDADFEMARSGRPKSDASAAKRMIAASLGGKSGGSSGGKKINNEARK